MVAGFARLRRGVIGGIVYLGGWVLILGQMAGVFGGGCQCGWGCGWFWLKSCGPGDQVSGGMVLGVWFGEYWVIGMVLGEDLGRDKMGMDFCGKVTFSGGV